MSTIGKLTSLRETRRGESTLETSGEDVKTTLETSVEDAIHLAATSYARPLI